MADAPFPPDVQTFVEERNGCDHFRGEPWDLGDEPEIKGRREFIFANIKELCTGTDNKLAALRSKYRNNPMVTKRLEDYDGKIENE